MYLKKCNTLLYVISILIAVLTGCRSSVSSNNEIPMKKLNFPSIYKYSSLVKKGNLNVAFIFDYRPLPPDVHYSKGYYIEEGSEKVYDLALPDDPRCNLSTHYSVGKMFPDGRLQVWKLCNKVVGTDRYLLAYDWDSGFLEDISGILPVGPTSTSWNPEQTKGIASLSDAFASGTLYLIRPGGFDPLDLTITDDGKSWNVKDDFPDFKGVDNGATGNVGRADWSSDGQSIAFFASPDAIGKMGSSRFGVEYKLYIMSVEKMNPKPVLDNIHYPHIIEWSPDSNYIAFIGEYGSFRQDGVWLYSIKENKIINIAKGRFANILWNDNNSLIANQCDKDYTCSEIDEYDLSNVMK